MLPLGHEVRIVGGIVLAASVLLGWFVDPALQTFGPRGYTHCHDIQCSAIDIELPPATSVFGVFVIVLALAAATAAFVNRWYRPFAIATLLAGVAFAIASFSDGGAVTRDSEGASRIAVGFPLFLLAASTLLARIRTTTNMNALR